MQQYNRHILTAPRTSCFFWCLFSESWSASDREHSIYCINSAVPFGRLYCDSLVYLTRFYSCCFIFAIYYLSGPKYSCMWLRILPFYLVGSRCFVDLRVVLDLRFIRCLYYVFSILHRIYLTWGRASPISSSFTITINRILSSLPRITILYDSFNYTKKLLYSITLLCETFEVFCLPDLLTKIF
jgi:hypothetical protein